MSALINTGSIPDAIWLMLLLYLGFMLFGRKDQTVAAMGSMIGLIFGILLMAYIGVWIGIVLILLNIYLLYKAILVEPSK